jgi:hypothetical protein
MPPRPAPWLKRVLKSATANYLTETCTIEAQEDTQSEYGTPELTWRVVAEDVRCQVIMMGRNFSTSSADVVSSQESIEDSYRIICPSGTALDINQRVTVGGLKYNITRLITDRSSETDAQALMTRQR